MTQQKIIFTISETDKGHKVKLDFMPPLANTEKFKTMSEARKRLQNVAANLAKNVMNALQ